MQRRESTPQSVPRWMWSTNQSTTSRRNVSGYEKARKLGDSPRFGVIVFFPYCCAPIVGILLSLCSDFASDVLLPRCLR